ncbi:MAG TPA: cytochrome c-type biogenesis protein CcmH [Gemmatimonadales bacterium]|nr:cytochrome c-type biogenesis protein CcmH [Gemmatimonadales bacterium]
MDALSRRAFLAAAVAGAGAAIQDTVRGGRVYDPDRAGRAQAPITAADNDAHIQAIEKKLRCTCGCGLDIYTCRTTDFSCTYSPALHKEVLRLAGQGQTAQQVIDAFVAQYGQAALMAPPRRGFNLLGYYLPRALIVIAGAVLVFLLYRWTRESQTPAPASAPPLDATPEELERLRQELAKLDG